MSGKKVEAPEKIDRRVRRTRDALGDALVALMQEKPFDAITVQDVLERAGVSRSTFYVHYRDKNDLFLSDADEFFEAMATHLSLSRDTSDRVVPVRELFAHVAQMRPLYDALVAAGRLGDLLELARGHFARGIERRLAESGRLPGARAGDRPALAAALAGALLSLLTWWIDRGMKESPAALDDVFHDLLRTGDGSKIRS